MSALERHEVASHAIPGREVRDLGHAVLLYDQRDYEPFWNRLQAVRWPEDRMGFDRRMVETLALFASLGRAPHIWPSPVHGSPRDLVARLLAEGFHDVGGGHVMVLDDETACGPIRLAELAPDVTVEAVTPATADPDGATDAMAGILVEAFGTLPGRRPELAADLRRSLGDSRLSLSLVLVDGEPAACAKATTFDGFTYVSSVGTREAFRGRGLAALATRQVVVAGRGRVPSVVYLGVFSGNASALRVYDRLGFASVGESPDLLLD